VIGGILVICPGARRSPTTTRMVGRPHFHPGVVGMRWPRSPTAVVQASREPGEKLEDALS